MPKHPQK